MNNTRERILRMRKSMSVKAIAEFLNTTPENIQKIIDGENVDISETQEGFQSIIEVKTSFTVHRQKVIGVWKAKGGAGGTITAINLAKLTSEYMRTVLICLNFSEGGSDLIHYLDLPYINLSAQALKDGVNHCTEVKNNFFVMHPITRLDTEIEKEDIKSLILKAREDYDCVILDLPDTVNDVILEAVKSCSNIVFVMQNLQQESQRIARLAHIFANKEQVFIANQGLKAEECTHALSVDYDYEQIVEIPFDKTIKERLEKQSPFMPVKSPFFQALESVYTLIFQEVSQGAKKDIAASAFSYQWRKIRKKIAIWTYGFKIYDLAKEGVHVFVCVCVLLASLYSMRIGFAVKAVEKIHEFLSNII